MFPIERLQTVNSYCGNGRGYQGCQHDASRRPTYIWEPSGYEVHAGKRIEKRDLQDGHFKVSAVTDFDAGRGDEFSKNNEIIGFRIFVSISKKDSIT